MVPSRRGGLCRFMLGEHEGTFTCMVVLDNAAHIQERTDSIANTAWLVARGVPGKPFTWNHPGFHPGETVYPRETPGISSSGAKNKIGGVLGHACADSGPKSFEVGRPQASRSADYTEAPTLR